MRWWVGGGWGVDALVGEASRPRPHLDLVVAPEHRAAAEAALAAVPGAVQLHDVDPDRHPREVLAGSGVIGGRVVPCLSAEGQLLGRAGYEPDDADRHDVGLLRDRLGLAVPPPFGGPGLSPPSVRRAVPRDAAAAAAVNLRAALLAYHHIFPPSAPKPTLRRLWAIYRQRFSAPSRGLVLEAGGALVGCVAAAVDDAGEGEVVGLYVDPSRWGRGLGARLLAEVLADLRRSGATSARLWVLERNSRARGMYERRGWRTDGATRAVSTTGTVVELRYRLELPDRSDRT